MQRTEVLITYKAGPAVSVHKKDGTLMTTLKEGNNQITVFVDEAASLRQAEASVQPPRAAPESVAPAGMNGEPAPATPELPADPVPPEVPGSDVHAPLSTSDALS